MMSSRAMLDEGRVQTVAYDQTESQIVFEATDEDGNTAVYKTGIFPDPDLYERLDDADVSSQRRSRRRLRRCSLS